MANTYSQCYFHLVFAVKNRRALIGKEWKNDLEKYITGIIQSYNHKLLAINSESDHIHIFIGYNLNQLIPDLVEEIKTSSNAWINSNGFANCMFAWQKGYGAFTHSKSTTESVIRYIANQESHHRKKTFRDEYLEILKRNDIRYVDGYLFEFFE